MPIVNARTSTPSTSSTPKQLFRVTISFTAPNIAAAKRVHAAMKAVANGIGTAIEGAGLQTKVKNVRLDERATLQPYVRNLRRPRSGKVWKNLAKNG